MALRDFNFNRRITAIYTSSFVAFRVKIAIFFYRSKIHVLIFPHTFIGNQKVALKPRNISMMMPCFLTNIHKFHI